MVGESFLRNTMKELSEMMKRAKVNKHPPPYMYEMFNINGYFAGIAMKGPLKLVNPLVDALNDDHHLPKYVILVPDKDLFTDSKKEQTAYAMGSNIHYVITQTDVHLERRHQDLLNKRPGALSKDFPKSIWIRMLKRPVNQLKENAELFGLRGKFNSILEDRLLDGNAENHHIMSIEVAANHFDLAGNLTDKGKEEFWIEVDKAIKKFDRGEIPLRPRKYIEPKPQDFINKAMKSHNEENLKKFKKLPSPPKRYSNEKSNERSRDKGNHSPEERLELNRKPVSRHDEPTYRSRNRARRSTSRGRKSDRDRDFERSNSHRHRHHRSRSRIRSRDRVHTAKLEKQIMEDTEKIQGLHTGEGHTQAVTTNSNTTFALCRVNFTAFRTFIH